MKQDDIEKLWQEFEEKTGRKLFDIGDDEKYLYVTWLEEELVASRIAQVLSAVPTLEDLKNKVQDKGYSWQEVIGWKCCYEWMVGEITRRHCG